MITLRSGATSEGELRAWVLARPTVRVADLQRRGLTYHQACRELEDLESDRLLGRRLVNGIPEWSVAYAVDEERVAALRKLHGKAPRLLGVDLASGPDRAAYAVNGRPVTKRRAEQVRRHIDEHHPGVLSRCPRCRR